MSYNTVTIQMLSIMLRSFYILTLFHFETEFYPPHFQMFFVIIVQRMTE